MASMRAFHIFCIILVSMSLLGASSAVAARFCACPGHGQQQAEKTMDCHKNMAKSDQKQEKKTCCCDKMMGCKISFQAIGAGGYATAFSVASLHYAALQPLLNSQDFAPAPQPPKA